MSILISNIKNVVSAAPGCNDTHMRAAALQDVALVCGSIICKTSGVRASLLACSMQLAQPESERQSMLRLVQAVPICRNPANRASGSEIQTQEGAGWKSQERLRRLRANWACYCREWVQSARLLWRAWSW